MVSSALQALHSVLPAVAAQVEADLTQGSAPIVDLSVPEPKPPGWLDRQKAPLQIGQLKALAAPFYTRLHAVAPAWLASQRQTNGTELGGIFPWTDDPSDDKPHALANLGQLKAVFALRFEQDADNDGLPDLWEQSMAARLLDLGHPPVHWGQHYQSLLLGNLDPQATLPGCNGTILDAFLSNASPIQPFGVALPVWTVANSGETGNHDPPDQPVIRSRTVTLPAGSRALMIVTVASKEFDYYTNPANNQTEYNDLLTWRLVRSHGQTLSGEVNVNNRHQQWIAARESGQTITGLMNPLHHEHVEMLQAPPDEPLVVEITLSAVNVSDNDLASEIAIGLLPVDLDVNGDGDISDPCDGLATYMPGYELSTAKLHTGTSFENSQYAGPQSMNIIIDNLPSSMADQAHIRIVAASNWFGYCGNGSIHGESKFSPYWDFTLTENKTNAPIQEQEATVSIASNKMIMPIYCHDYGGWCEVEITLKKNGASIGSPIKITLPNDGNGDRLADCWQDAEITAWNNQFGDTRPISDAERSKMKPGSGYDLSDYADDEMRKSDGASGSMPEMADEGDGLKVMEEYRGFILDAGPGVTSTGHCRLSLARKEALFQFLVMPQITDGSNPGNCANTAAQGFDAAQRFQTVHAFYKSKYPNAGADLDCYMVKLPLNPDASKVVRYSDNTTRPAYLENAKLRPISGHTRPSKALTYIYYDNRLFEENFAQHNEIYSPDLKDTPVERAFERARTAAEDLKGPGTLDHFAVCAFYNRFGFYGKGTNWNLGVNELHKTAFSNHLPVIEPVSPTVDPTPWKRGCQFAVNAISEDPSNNFSNGQMEYAIAHEIGHTLIWARHSGHPGSYPGLMADFPTGTIVTSLSQFQIDSDVVSLVDLRTRSSVIK